MSDVRNNQPLRVVANWQAGPSITLPVQQVEAVTELLDRRQVRHWVSATAIAWEGKPAVTVINLGLGTDPAFVQQVLDSAA